MRREVREAGLISIFSLVSECNSSYNETGINNSKLVEAPIALYS